MYFAISKIKTALVPLFNPCCPKALPSIIINPKNRVEILIKRRYLTIKSGI
jgi:hypothetical protein